MYGKILLDCLDVFPAALAREDLDVTGYLLPGPRFAGSHLDVSRYELVAPFL